MMISKETADEKVKGGWIRAWMAFEAFAANNETVDKSLGSLLNRLEDLEALKVYKKELTEPKRVENPFPQAPKIKEAFSRTCSIEVVVKKFKDLSDIVINFGPSAVEILEPKKLMLEAGEAQNVLNGIADMMHRFVMSGLGGALLIHGKAEGKN